MKLLILFVCLCLFVVNNIEGASWRIDAKDPKYPNKCYREGPPRILMDLNTKKRAASGKCESWACGADYSLTYESCGVYLTQIEHCRSIAGDLSRLYPDCCPEYIC